MVEGYYKVLNMVVILCLIAVFHPFFGFFPKLLSRPIITAILSATPCMFFTGGLLAPIELLKSIGNIVSYVRIMASDLTSVLLACVANELSGHIRDIIFGVAIATLLHILNIILLFLGLSLLPYIRFGSITSNFSASLFSREG